MTKLRTKIIVSILTITLVILAVLGFIIGEVFKEFYFEQLTDRMKKEAELVSYTTLPSVVEKDYLTVNLQSKKISEYLSARVTIILADGTVIGESATNPKSMENHLTRPEIQSIIKGIYKPEIRYSTTIEAELIYYAVPMREADNTIGFVRLGIPIEALMQMNQNIWLILTVSFSLAFFAIVLITARVANQMMLPVEQATKVAYQLTEGNYKARVIEGRKDEIGQLSRSINLLAYHLDKLTKRHQVQTERMETLINNIGSGLVFINSRGYITLVNRAITDIFQEETDNWLHKLYYEKMEHKEIIKMIQLIFMVESKQRKEIKITNGLESSHFIVDGVPIMREDKLKGIALVFHDITELKNLEQVRKDFVANVSHELNTPITSIKGFSETLLDGALDNRDYLKKFLGIIWKESDRLQTIIADLLELSKIEQQVFTLNWKRTNLKEIAEDVVMMLKAKAEEKSVTLDVAVQGNTIIEADPIRVKQVAINLISNSIMYTPNHGTVTVRLNEKDKEIVFEVRDTGIGISEQELPRIFERFYRVDRARSRNSGGTGLGLAIVKHLVEAHYGRIEVNSKVGQGTSFRIYFRKKQQS